LLTSMLDVQSYANRNRRRITLFFADQVARLRGLNIRLYVE